MHDVHDEHPCKRMSDCEGWHPLFHPGRFGVEVRPLDLDNLDLFEPIACASRDHTRPGEVHTSEPLIEKCSSFGRLEIVRLISST